MLTKHIDFLDMWATKRFILKKRDSAKILNIKMAFDVGQSKKLNKISVVSVALLASTTDDEQ